MRGVKIKHCNGHTESDNHVEQEEATHSSSKKHQGQQGKHLRNEFDELFLAKIASHTLKPIKKVQAKPSLLRIDGDVCVLVRSVLGTFCHHRQSHFVFVVLTFNTSLSAMCMAQRSRCLLCHCC